MGLWIALAVVFLLLLAFFLLCRMIGGRFVRNLSRQNPGERFTPDIDISFYTNGPLPALAEKGLAYMDSRPQEEIDITSHDGLRLHGVLFPAEGGTKNFVLGIHGFQSHARNEFAPHIEFYHSQGFSMLLPDDRAHGLSEGQYITMGVKDRLDCVDWANYLVERFGSDCRILLHGVSMGGATVLSASAEKTLPPQVIGVVSDCGFTCVEEAFSAQIQSLYHISPAFPVAVCRWFAKHKADFDFREARPSDQVKEAKVPIFFVQGVEDCMVPQEMARRLYEACGSRKELLLVEGASHAESIALDPEGYHRGILNLLK